MPFEIKRSRNVPAAIAAAAAALALAAGVASFVPQAIADSSIRLEIDGIGLMTPVKNIELQGTQLISPDRIAGAYTSAENKTLLIGHSTTVFRDLDELTGDMPVEFDGKTYKVKKIELLPVADIDMHSLVLPADRPTIVLMTCAGEETDGNFSHRLIVTAEAA